jgi:hypothetical protein
VQASEEGVPVEPGLPISAAARDVGVDAGTLRAWQRRYGLGASARSPGGHRRYTAEDLHRIRAVRDLVGAGISTADAARSVLSVPVWHLDHGSAGSAGRFGVPEPGEGVGAEPDRLFRAALDLDGTTAGEVLHAGVGRRGSRWAWEALMAPALRRIDSCDASRAHRVTSEHLISHLVAGALSVQLSRRTVTTSPRQILLACAPVEQHSLPLLALAASLAESGVGSSLLGARTPRSALRRAAGDEEVRVVVVLAVLPVSTKDLVGSPRRPGLTWIAGGPGWDREQLSSDVVHVNDLTTAIDAICSALAG